jgi:hypothetical protein
MRKAGLAWAFAMVFLLCAERAFAQADEIQVYDAEIAAPGVFNLMVHNNYTFDGLATPRLYSFKAPTSRLVSKSASLFRCCCFSGHGNFLT